VYVSSESSQATHHFQGFLPAVVRTLFRVLNLPALCICIGFDPLKDAAPARVLFLKAGLGAHLACIWISLIWEF
jgi:hypothetical protein